MGNNNHGCYCSRKQTENEICYNYKNRNLSCDNIAYLQHKINLIQIKNKNLNDTSINETYDSIKENKQNYQNNSKHKTNSLNSQRSISSKHSKSMPFSNNITNINLIYNNQNFLSKDISLTQLKPKPNKLNKANKVKRNPKSINSHLCPSLIGLNSILEKKINSLLIQTSPNPSNTNSHIINS